MKVAHNTTEITNNDRLEVKNCTSITFYNLFENDVFIITNNVKISLGSEKSLEYKYDGFTCDKEFQIDVNGQTTGRLIVDYNVLIECSQLK